MSNGKNKQSLQGKECFSRMNFLLQASQLMAGRNNVLSSYYGQLCRSIGKKSVLRCDPDVKRSLCKRCSLAQQPGVTADVSAVASTLRKMGKPAHNVDANVQLQLTCRKCGSRRNFRVNPDYGFWLENPASVAEAVTLNEKIPTVAQKPTTQSVGKPALNVAENTKNAQQNKRRRREPKKVLAGDKVNEAMEAQ